MSRVVTPGDGFSGFGLDFRHNKNVIEFLSESVELKNSRGKRCRRRLYVLHALSSRGVHMDDVGAYSPKTNVSNDLLIWILRLWYSMKPGFLNLFMKKFTRERVVPIISDKVSWETIGSSSSGWCCTFP